MRAWLEITDKLSAAGVLIVSWIYYYIKLANWRRKLRTARTGPRRTPQV